MAKLRRLFETKAERASKLPVGTWFVWPDTKPQRNKYYQPKLYCVQEENKPSRPFDWDIGIWGAEGVNSPEAAHDRLTVTAQALNAMHSSEASALTYLKEQKKQRQIRASEAMGRLLNKHNKLD